MKKWLSIALVLLLAVSVMSCNKNENKKNETKDDTLEIEAVEAKPILKVEENRPVVTIVFNDYDSVTLELYPELAPNTVNNFLTLANQGYYNGLKIHRVVEDFMIQGGDPIGNGTGGPGYNIKAELNVANGPFVSYLSHKRGVLSMARGEAIDTAGSQFFIVHQDVPGIDQMYTAFGQVIDNIEVIDEIASVETGEFENPLEEVIIQEVKVELNGYVLEEPETIE